MCKKQTDRTDNKHTIPAVTANFKVASVALALVTDGDKANNTDKYVFVLIYGCNILLKPLPIELDNFPFNRNSLNIICNCDNPVFIHPASNLLAFYLIYIDNICISYICNVLIVHTYHQSGFINRFNIFFSKSRFTFTSCTINHYKI